MDIDPKNIDELEAFLLDIESEAAHAAYDERWIHPDVSLGPTHDNDPQAAEPALLPPLDAELPAPVYDTWE